jgi:hypothetical protein
MIDRTIPISSSPREQLKVVPPDHASSTHRRVHCLPSTVQPNIAVSPSRRSQDIPASTGGLAHPTAKKKIKIKKLSKVVVIFSRAQSESYFLRIRMLATKVFFCCKRSVGRATVSTH